MIPSSQTAQLSTHLVPIEHEKPTIEYERLIKKSKTDNSQADEHPSLPPFSTFVKELKSTEPQSSISGRPFAEIQNPSYLSILNRVKQLETVIEKLSDNMSDLCNEFSSKVNQSCPSNFFSQGPFHQTNFSVEQNFLALSQIYISTQKNFIDSLCQLGKFREAKEEVKKVLMLPGEQQNLFAITQYADILRQQNKLKKALKHFEKALALPSGQQDLFTVTRYAETLRQQNKLKEALEHFEKALALPGGQQDLFTVIHYAHTLLQLGKLDEAEKQFNNALALPGGQQNYLIIRHLKSYQVKKETNDQSHSQ